jgi:hypothetical protein
MRQPQVGRVIAEAIDLLQILRFRGKSALHRAQRRVIPGVGATLVIQETDNPDSYLPDRATETIHRRKAARVKRWEYGAAILLASSQGFASVRDHRRSQ